MKKWLLLLLYCVIPAAFAANLNKTETMLQQYVIKQQKAEQTLLKKLVNINSGTSNVRGVNRIADRLTPYFKQLGFRVRYFQEPAHLHRAKTLIAERKGSGPSILLIAHLDTVFRSTSHFKQYELKKNSAKGPGVTDDKGGLVILLYALKALHSVHALQGKNITVILTGDEEDSGKPTSLSRQPLFAAAKNAAIALDFEPAITLNTATIARRGISMWTIETHGKESHSASIFQSGVGDGAIFELSRILNTMRLELQNEKYLSFNPGIMIAGNKIAFNERASKGEAFGKENVVSSIALAKGDLRFLSEDQEKAAQAKMLKIAQQSLASTDATISFTAGIPAMSPKEQNKQLLERYSQVSLDLDQGPIKPLDPGLRGAGDISHVAALVPANLSGLGALGFGAHSENEHIELSSLPVQTMRAAIFIYRLTA